MITSNYRWLWIVLSYWSCLLLFIWLLVSFRKRVGGLKLEDLPGLEALQIPGLISIYFLFSVLISVSLFSSDFRAFACYSGLTGIFIILHWRFLVWISDWRIIAIWLFEEQKSLWLSIILFNKTSLFNLILVKMAMSFENNV
jgi:hypothetical protein